MRLPALSAAWAPLRVFALCLALLGCGPPARTEPAVQRLQCEQPHGVSVAVLHRGGEPLAVTLAVVAGTRDCATRSTRPPRREGPGWRFDWQDDVIGAHYAAALMPLPGGGFRLRLSEPGAPGGPAATVACSSLALPAETLLDPGDARCTSREERSAASP
ncbi:MAG TPA: hypothetical protein VLA16_16915 [Ideonella sp.]|nr:hypothetical protein [Ideonella sp.]